jgi:hypothetical protein
MPNASLSAAPPGGPQRGDSPGPLARYRRVLAAVRHERGERCEACRVPARSAHHILSVGLLGIAADLVSEPANLMILCDDCHALMHPGYRSYPWLKAGTARGRALQGAR